MVLGKMKELNFYDLFHLPLFFLKHRREVLKRTGPLIARLIDHLSSTRSQESVTIDELAGEHAEVSSKDSHRRVRILRAALAPRRWNVRSQVWIQKSEYTRKESFEDLTGPR